MQCLLTTLFKHTCKERGRGAGDDHGWQGQSLFLLTPNQFLKQTILQHLLLKEMTYKEF